MATYGNKTYKFKNSAGAICRYPVAANVVIYRGQMVALEASGYAIPGADDPTQVDETALTPTLFVGFAMEQVDNTNGSDGTKYVRVDRRKQVMRDMVITDTTTIANVGDIVYLGLQEINSDEYTADSDQNESVYLAASSTNYVPVGMITKWTSAHVVDVDIMCGVLPFSTALYTTTADLASVADAKGADLIGITTDIGFTGTDVKAALEEIYTHMTTSQGYIPLDICSLRVIDSDEVHNKTNIGGLLCEDSTPILKRTDTAQDKSLVVHWTTSGVEELICQIPKPPDLDASANLVLHALIGKGSNTDDSAKFEVGFWDGIGDTEYSTQVTLATSALTEYTMALTAANLSAAPGVINVRMNPTDTHDNDTIQLAGLWVEYTKAQLTS